MSVQVLAPTSWHFAQAAIPLTEAEWTPCTQFPTEIHLELRAANRIPDWNKGRTEHDVQCELVYHTLESS
jgi:beta-mannosidase